MPAGGVPSQRKARPIELAAPRSARRNRPRRPRRCSLPDPTNRRSIHFDFPPRRCRLSFSNSILARMPGGKPTRRVEVLCSLRCACAAALVTQASAARCGASCVAICLKRRHPSSSAGRRRYGTRKRSVAEDRRLATQPAELQPQFGCGGDEEGVVDATEGACRYRGSRQEAGRGQVGN